jgi:S-(hydroxymethyl)glutathione dehydrogenase/alcohol dehydrogenase
MAALQGAVNAGARYVFAIDPVEWKRDQALKFGATHVYPDIDAALMGIAAVTAGLMAKKVIVTVGEVHGQDVDGFMNITAKGGTCVLTAIGSLLENDVKLNLDDMITRQYKLEQINDGYQDMLEGRNIRGIIRYTDADR